MVSDPERLRGILENLVENAIKHGVARVEGTGHIAIEARVVGDELLLRVRDDGPGLPDERFTTPPGEFRAALRGTTVRPATAPEYDYELPSSEQDGFQFTATVGVQVSPDVATMFSFHTASLAEGTSLTLLEAMSRPLARAADRWRTPRCHG